ncbi:LL-diaminopimelate aminotransferase [Paenibacillus macerans]|uniref:LL-diaminopimelate aminotransferase n=1 Tax=Paenibacillus macerans TaxID=44252 RepID=UPI00203D1334|nr:LL-diaminopimelate aminotransferase [Paenibacillus macerans]MCM3703661.1 LL-diaminopimelate aminotransferase [Paenibacillus macerans]
MEFTPSDKVQQMATGIFTELARRKRSASGRGIEVIDLSVGSPDLPPPPLVVEKLAASAQHAENYGYALGGTREFHGAVCYFYRRRYGVELDPEEEVLQTMGSQDGLAHLAMAVINPGDYVLIPDPGYPIYEAGVVLAGGKVHPLPLREENRYLPQLEQIPHEILARTKMMILSYPGNPVPAMADAAFFEEAIRFAKRHNILIVHDFAYSELIFDGRSRLSFMAVPGAREVGIEFNSLSKTFNMAGCRIGYAVGHPGVLRALGMLKSNIDYGVFLPVQQAAAAALMADDRLLETQVKEYEVRRDTLISGLARVGWEVAKPPATMFVCAKIPAGWTSRELAFALIELAGVAVVPGDAFGRQGEGYVRIALVQPADRLAEAAERIGRFLRQQHDLRSQNQP